MLFYLSAFGVQDLSATLVDQALNIQGRVEADPNLDAATKAQIDGLVAAVQANQGARQSFIKKAAEAAAATQAADQTGRQYRLDLEALSAEPVSPIDPNATMESLDAKAKLSRDHVVELKKKLEVNAAEGLKRIARRQNYRTQLDAIDKRIADAKAQLKSTEGDATLLVEASGLRFESEVLAAEAEKALLEALLARDEAEERESVLKKQYDFIELKLKREEATLQKLEAVLASKRQRMASQLANAAVLKEAKIQVSTQAIRFLASSYALNTEMAKRNLELEQNSLQIKAKADKLKQRVESLEKKFLETKGRVSAIGLTGSVGAMLRTRKGELALMMSEHREMLKTASIIEELQYDIFDIDHRQKELSPELIRSEIVEAYGEQRQAVWAELEAPIKELIEERLGILKATRASLTRYSDSLLDIQSSTRSKSEIVKRFSEYINERILWIRSNKLLFSQLEFDEGDEVAFSSTAWLKAGKEMVQVVISRPVPIGLGALLYVFLLFRRKRLRSEIDRLGEVAARGSCESFWPTARAFLLSMLFALTLPLTPFLLGLVMLNAPFGASTLFVAVGRSLIAAALFALPFEALRVICRRKGLGNMHFDWSLVSVSRLKRNLDWVVWPGAVLVFVVCLLLQLNHTHRVDLLERVFFVVGLLFAAYFLYRTFNRKDGVFSEYLKSNLQTWANQTSALWTGFILVVPLSLALLAICGYYYTALNLAECAYFSFAFAVLVETLRAMTRRLVLVRKRRSFILAARRKREVEIQAHRAALKEKAKAREEAAKRGETLPVETAPAPVETFNVQTEIEADEIAGNVIQVQKLISISLVLVWGIGMWLIWIDVLPALKELDNYTVWSSHVVENGGDAAAVEAETSTATSLLPGTATSEGQGSSVKNSEPVRQVTIRDLLLFMIITTVTWVLARSLPSAMEILFLSSLPVDRSFRFAIKAITSYLIVVIGVVLAFRSLSISWSSVQWLATALTFGLAFGLQEIFANFVAGIILMFERPMRIGDFITVDEFTGHVTKIQTRATTIINRDRKEYVIPNKDFITGRLVNWTLSDAINRIEFVVGIAYGSDVEQAKSIIYSICKKHPKVLDKPEVQVIFGEFGESSLNLTVRAFIGDVEIRPVITDSLHTLINKEFNEAGIEIAFPQRDLHVRSVDLKAGQALQQLNPEVDADLS